MILGATNYSSFCYKKQGDFHKAIYHKLGAYYVPVFSFCLWSIQNKPYEKAKWNYWKFPVFCFHLWCGRGKWILWQTDIKVEKEPKSGNYKKFELSSESGKKHENMRMFTEQAPSMISIQWFFFLLNLINDISTIIFTKLKWGFS